MIHLPAVLKHLLAILDDVMEHDFKVFTMNLQGILIFWVHIYIYIYTYICYIRHDIHEKTVHPRNNRSSMKKTVLSRTST